MKKILFILVLTVIVNTLIQAQTKTKQTTVKANTLEQPVIETQTATPPPTQTFDKTVVPVTSKSPKGNSAILSPPPTTTAGTNVAQLPDLKVVSLSLTKLGSDPNGVGLTTYSFEVSYTIKNEGNVAVDARLVDVNGTIDYENATVYRPIAGCGSGLTSLSGNMINPGATYGGSYRCSNVSLENSQHYIYTLTVDRSNKVAESNEENNTAKISILFQ